MEHNYFDFNISQMSAIVALFISTFSLPDDDAMIDSCNAVVISCVREWYDANGMVLNYETEPIEEGALLYAGLHLVEVKEMTDNIVKNLIGIK